MEDNRHPIIKKLDDYLANASEEQLRQDWEELKQYNQGGPEMLDCLNRAEKRIKANNMDRTDFINKLQESAARLAHGLGCDNMDVSKGDCGVWDKMYPRATMTEYLEEKYGDCSTELTFTNNDETIKVKFRFRFSSPCISLAQKTETPVEGGVITETNFIELIFDDAVSIKGEDGKVRTVNNGDFKCVQVMLWNNWDILRDQLTDALDNDIKAVVKL